MVSASNSRASCFPSLASEVFADAEERGGCKAESVDDFSPFRRLLNSITGRCLEEVLLSFSPVILDEGKTSKAGRRNVAMK